MFSQKVEKGKYQGHKFSFLCQETLKLMEIESRKNWYSLKLTFAEFRLLNRILKGYWKACLVQIVKTSVNLSKHTWIIKLYGPNTSSKLFRTFAEKLLQAWESSYNFKKHFKKTILKRKVIQKTIIYHIKYKFKRI